MYRENQLIDFPDTFFYYIGLFSQTLLLLEGEKTNCHFFMLK